MADKEASSVVTSDNATTFYAERLGLADQQPEPEVVPTPVDTESEPAKEQSEPEAKEDAEKQDKRSDKLNKRFDKVTQRAKEAEAKAEALEKRLREFEARQSQPAQEPVKERNVDEKPQAHQFNDAFEYAEALAEWSVENALKQKDAEEAARKEQKAQEKVIKSWAEKVNKAKSNLPDFDVMVQSSTVQVSNELRDSILESDVGPQILYHLASDEDYAKKLAEMPTAKAMKEFGKLEARFEAKDEKPKAKDKEPVRNTKAPEPIKPLTGGKIGADVMVDTNGEYHGTYAQWKAARQAGKLR